MYKTRKLNSCTLEKAFSEFRIPTICRSVDLFKTNMAVNIKFAKGINKINTSGIRF